MSDERYYTVTADFDPNVTVQVTDPWTPTAPAGQDPSDMRARRLTIAAGGRFPPNVLGRKAKNGRALVQVWTDGPVVAGDVYYALGSNDAAESDPPNTIRGAPTVLTTSPSTAQPILLGPTDHLAIDTQGVTTTCYIAVLDLSEKELLAWLAGTQGDIVLTNDPPTQIDIGDAAEVGTSTEAARADHQHAMPAPLAPADVDKFAAAAGVATTAARADHKHDISTGQPLTVSGPTNAEGVSRPLARADHQHRLEVGVQQDSVAVGARPTLNITGGAAVVDNPGDDRVDVAVHPHEVTLDLHLDNAASLPADLGGVAAISGEIVSVSMTANLEITVGALDAGLELGGNPVPDSLVSLAAATPAFTAASAVPTAPNTVAAGDVIVARFSGTNTAPADVTLTILIRAV